MKRERLHDSIVWKLAEDLSPIFPYATISNRGLNLYVKDQPELKESMDSNKFFTSKGEYDPSWFEKFNKRMALTNNLKTVTIASLPEPYQIDEEKIILEVVDSLRKYGSIESIVSEKKI